MAGYNTVWILHCCIPLIHVVAYVQVVASEESQYLLPSDNSFTEQSHQMLTA